MSSPKVSVIIPTYNRAAFLGAAVRSVLDQTFGDFEVIVVDDGSTDGTDEVVRDIADPRVRYLRQEHKGISSAMNGGIRAASGAYIARLDSDDVWLPEMLQVEVAVLEARPEVGLVSAKGQAMNVSGEILSTTAGLPERYPGDSFRSMLYDDCTCNITVIARRSCFDRVGLYDESLEGNEDWDMWLRMARHYRLAQVDRVLAHFRWHEGNVTGVRSPLFAEILEGRAKVLDKVFRCEDLPPEIVAMKPIAYRNVFTVIGLRWLNVRQPRRALRAFWRALRSGGNPVVALMRILWFVGNMEMFSRFSRGRQFVRATAALRRRWRTQGGASI